MQHKLTLLLLPLLILFSSLLQAAAPGKAAIATAHPLATKAGEEVLKKGGNAFDAAVAITAALAVVEPYGSGLGGGGFWLMHRASDKRNVMIDGREAAPLLATANMYLDKSGQHLREKSLNGPLAAGIPGVPAAIDHISRLYGELPLAEVLAPAIRYARDGFEVTDRYRKLIGFRKSVLQQFPAAASIFLHNNEAPPNKHKIIQTDLANTLQMMADGGAYQFYQGKFTRQMVDAVRQDGGIWQSLDMQQYRVRERRPVQYQYHDMQITSAAPPSSGGIVLAQSLGILEHFDLKNMSRVQRMHHIVEAMRRAYRDRAAYLGDPDFVKVPETRLLNEDYIAGLSLGIQSDTATASKELGSFSEVQQGQNTTHFSVIDKQGNRVAATLSINLPFGSGYVVPGTGVLLNNEMDDFASKANAPNAYGLVGDQANRIQPKKRPLSSMTPTFVETDDRLAILGTPGGSRIISMVLLGVLDFADGHMPSSWVSVPRYHHQYLPDEIQFEQNALTFPEQKALQRYGHKLNEKNRRYGNMQAILWHKRLGQVFAASDPRGEGSSVVFDY